ncbi:MAG: division plane positioning ATPase MipZ [Holosporales bacterium]|jgi:chromosome partitioning protein|nr:division plane positioning ATPase MipZ [Holosporales bacterium]
MAGPYIVVLGNEKGGTGKSTIAMHLIVSLLKGGATVASIDTDARQGTLTRYIANRTKTAEAHKIVMPVHTPLFCSNNTDTTKARGEDEVQLTKVIENFSSYDYVVIDTPGNNTFLSRMAHSIADTIITPLNDSFIDLDMLIKLESGAIENLRPSVYAEMVWEQKKEKAKRTGGSIDWIVLRNRLGSLFSKNREEMRKILESLAKRVGFRLLSGFCERVIFKELFIKGTTLLDLHETEVAMTLSHVAARQELHELVDALQLPIQKKQQYRERGAAVA